MLWQAHTLLLSAGTLAAVLVQMQGEYRGPRALLYAAKPLATLLVIALAAAAPPGAEPWVARWILAGLVFSLAGDVLLMLPSDRFAAGVASFLIAHLCYIAAFTHEAGFQLAPAPGLVLAVAAALVYQRLAPALGNLRIPVIVYVGVLVVMAWQALARSLTLPGSGPALAAVGACFFVVSDSALALARFQRPFAGSRAVVAGTYFVAQWLIALSLYPTGGAPSE
jgi:uncharacterized membrane protein YhhN